MPKSNMARQRSLRAFKWDLIEPVAIAPANTGRIAWFNVISYGRFPTPHDGLIVEAVNISNRDLATPATDMIGYLGKLAVRSFCGHGNPHQHSGYLPHRYQLSAEALCAIAPRLFFWRDGFWIAARGETATEFYGILRLPDGDTNHFSRQKVYALYPITIDESDSGFQSISSM